MAGEQIVFTFASNADAMIATKALKDAGVAAKMIPKPAGVDSAANLCLAVDGGSEVQATSTLSGSGVRFQAVVR
jgi:hypothetical protein